MIFVSAAVFLEQARACRPVTREEELRLAALMKQGDAGAREQLARGYLPFLASVIGRQDQKDQTLELVLRCLGALEKAVDGFDFFQEGERFSHRLSWVLRQTAAGCLADRRMRASEPFEQPTVVLTPYQTGEAETLVRLFYESVHGVCLGDYTQEQVDVWADGSADPVAWEQSFLQRYTVVARLDEQIVGFADLDGDYLDRLYVHKDYQRQGVASALEAAVVRHARKQGVGKLEVHASITARPFFEKRGWVITRGQQVERKGVRLTNFVMEKVLG